MSDRAQREKALREANAARKRGDLDAIGRIFAPHARFQRAGSNASPVATKVVGAEQYPALIAGMIKRFELLDSTIARMLIDGGTAAVQWHATIRSSVTGQTVETDLL